MSKWREELKENRKTVNLQSICRLSCLSVFMSKSFIFRSRSNHLLSLREIMKTVFFLQYKNGTFLKKHAETLTPPNRLFAVFAEEFLWFCSRLLWWRMQRHTDCSVIRLCLPPCSFPLQRPHYWHSIVWLMGDSIASFLWLKQLLAASKGQEMSLKCCSCFFHCYCHPQKSSNFFF